MSEDTSTSAHTELGDKALRDLGLIPAAVVAKRLGVGESTVRARMVRGTMPIEPVAFARGYYWRHEDVEALLKEPGEAPTN